MLNNKYNPLEVEINKYENWLDKGYFKVDNSKKNSFSIVIPPPNVTGKLHLGHAWDTAIQDILIRYKRMQGYSTLWLPGMDHAGIATQAKVDKKLKDMGINPRGITRDEWLKYAWEWKDEYSLNIRNQWAKLGLSLDYDKERFTLDDGLSSAVNEVFVKLYNEGLIYRGERIINWDPVAMTALSNEEVIYKDVAGKFYHMNYPIMDSDEYLTVATTRPETMFGDTGIAVNPNDERYKHLIGKYAVLPIKGTKLLIVGDEHADPEFGTGVVKITPAHDPNDFEVGKRHDLPIVKVLNKDATLNSECGEFEGLDRFDARKKLVEKLKEDGVLIKEEEITHSVGHSERTDAVSEPYLSKQWFVKMRPLADKVLDNQKDLDSKVNFVPSRYEKIMNHWMEITYDWCISRQLWWGHKIPAWYKDDEVYVGNTPPNEDGWIQDADVLDTWFSSALWPFSTMGWPNTESDDYKRYYPNNVLVTGYDIIPFWVNRMTFMGLHFTNTRPFKDCLIHGLIRDKDGRKMSKSLGNGVDPMDVCDKYGADSLRFFLTTTAASGMDLRYDEEKVASTWNFLNKLWNASRFVLMNTENFKDIDLSNLKSKDKWIISKLNKVIDGVNKSMDKYDFNIAGTLIYDFTWSDFCDNYIEMSKYDLEDISTKSTLIYCLENILKMLHPFAPFITEEIYKSLPIETLDTIMLSDYPVYNESLIFEKEEKEVAETIEFIKSFRAIKLENKMTKDLKVMFNNDSDYSLIIKMLKLSDSLVESKLSIKEYNVSTINLSATIFFEKEETEEDLKLKEKQIESLENSIKRREALLGNENYLKKAPQNLVDTEKESLEKEKIELNNLKGM